LSLHTLDRGGPGGTEGGARPEKKIGGSSAEAFVRTIPYDSMVADSDQIRHYRLASTSAGGLKSVVLLLEWRSNHVRHSSPYKPAIWSRRDRILAAAFDDAWETIKRSGSMFASPGHAGGARDVVAKHIIELGSGEYWTGTIFSRMRLPIWLVPTGMNALSILAARRPFSSGIKLKQI
jgi:hypothetical protein